MDNQKFINRIMEVMSEILSDKYGVKIILTARPKVSALCKDNQKTASSETAQK